ncbi:MAG: acetoacetate decarboxylase family protein, partial [Bacteroidota bacterium]
DGISFKLPVGATESPALMAAFACDYQAALKLMPSEIYPVRLFNGDAVFIVTIIDYRKTSIGKYVEYSLALACTRGSKPAPKMLPALFMKYFKTGQFILDLPVSSEISVKGGKGIWGMPKHKANLDFIIEEDRVSSSYEKDGKFAFKIEMKRPKSPTIKLSIGSVNYSHFRNMIMASYIYFSSKASINLFKSAQAKLFIGDHPRMDRLKSLGIKPKALFTAFLPSSTGTLDDHFECWFATYNNPEINPSEGLETVYGLQNSEEWLPAPSITDYQKFEIR